MAQPMGVHLVGSLPGASEDEAIRNVVKLLPNRLSTVPDGETGDRDYFTKWQVAAFPEEIRASYIRGSPTPKGFALEQRHIKPTRYDEVAISSYATFKKLREEGVIPHGVRFQVCVPGVGSAIYPAVDEEYRAQAYPLYLEQLIQDIKNLQAVIPATDLAVQIDLAMEIGVLEYARGRMASPEFQPCFEGDALESLLEWTVPLADAIKPEVPLGFHLCYGDRDHQHFIQPKDTSLLVELANALAARVKHRVAWVHVPCPKDRTDRAYYEPLSKLKLDGGKLFLGLVHANDREGTLERIRAAQSVRNSFGVATECGMGRTPPSEIDSTFHILAEVS